MCGRIANTLPIDAMAQMFEAVPANDLPDVPNYNVCPTTQISVVVSGNDRRLISMRWGFIPDWYQSPTDGPLLINARSETLAEKPAFRQACRQRRCLIPITGYYEWTKDTAGQRLPWYFSSVDRAPLVLGGIWQEWGADDPIKTCTIVTTPANDVVSNVFHRMPVLLKPEDYALWLGEKGKGAARLMRAAPEDALRFFRVHPQVNSNRAEGSDLIEPFDDDPIKPLF
ncbi:SOS response-associated peptidase [Cochlodiniinecator piscidefendens]|uniref:SOS response-associated peptidase n=1 Tax=Cochlodiniinecator piscidefendens TaxID=2715756 RepID=UPI00140CF84D|nr:SOS response-associated peptidase [Cochlodiniinecator piscidefendens]